MTDLAPPARRPDSVTFLQPWVDAKVFGTTETEVVSGILELTATDGGVDDDVVVALALAIRAPLHGSICVDLANPPAVADHTPGDTDDTTPTGSLTWPEPDTWLAKLKASPLCAQPAVPNSPDATLPPATDPPAPLVLDGTRLYTHRSWAEELTIAHRLRVLATTVSAPGPQPGDTAVPQGSEPGDDQLTDRQRQAITTATTRRLAVLAGGPGTGKTHTVARLLAALLLANPDNPPVVELAAPTGKAAARLSESIAAAAQGIAATGDANVAVAETLASYQPRTLHRLLGSRGRSGFSYGPNHYLAADVVVVDEASMVSAHLMATLVDALRPDARLVLVGDPDQLTSVEAGAVMADVVRVGTTHPSSLIASSVVTLEGSHRFGSQSAIGQLADAIRIGDADGVVDMLETGTATHGEVCWVNEALNGDHPVLNELVDHARLLKDLALGGDPATAVRKLANLAVLCANRTGPNGVAAWNAWVEPVLDGDTPQGSPAGRWTQRHNAGRRIPLSRAGRPVMVTANDYVNGVFNGDAGVVVTSGRRNFVAFPDDSGDVRLIEPGRLASLATMWATTIHKSQGSEFDRVVVVLPDRPSPLLTRQLLYTAVTRARHGVTVVGSADTIRRAVTTEVARASGLTDRLA